MCCQQKRLVYLMAVGGTEICVGHVWGSSTLACLWMFTDIYVFGTVDVLFINRRMAPMDGTNLSNSISFLRTPVSATQRLLMHFLILRRAIHFECQGSGPNGKNVGSSLEVLKCQFWRQI